MLRPPSLCHAVRIIAVTGSAKVVTNTLVTSPEHPVVVSFLTPPPQVDIILPSRCTLSHLASSCGCAVVLLPILFTTWKGKQTNKNNASPSWLPLLLLFFCTFQQATHPNIFPGVVVAVFSGEESTKIKTQVTFVPLESANKRLKRSERTCAFKTSTVA
ncbi:hypothetical protein TRVL_09058 [Trypanosoma vivax]|nr:hypothetical protein TRVL_09058 [Trypanosoma vivax]